MTRARSTRMVKQELRMSCGAACARQILLDAGITVSEHALREEAGYDEQFGIALEDLRDALHARHPAGRYVGGTLESLDQVDRTPTPFIVVIAKHFMIVDSIDANEVHLRDPAPLDDSDALGTETIMPRRTFNQAWRGGILFARGSP